MSDFISKLNVLVRASLNSVASGDTLRRIPPERIGTDIDGEIAALRQHIDEALNAEDAMQARLGDLTAQIETLDQSADAALLAGDDAKARAIVQQITRQQTAARTLTADLDDHRRATSELIERVNMLESMVSDARRTQASAEPLPPADLLDSTQNASRAYEDDAPGEVLSNLLRNSRTQATAAPTIPPVPPPVSSEPPAAPTHNVPINVRRDSPMPTPNTATVAPTPTVPPPSSIPITVTPAKTPDGAAIDADLAKRRARLSNSDGS